jgi:putative copper resistance protein D
LALFVAQVVPLELGFTSVQEWQNFVWQTALGQMMLARAGLGLFALGALALLRRRLALITCVVIGLLAQVTITRTSHTAAMGAGGAVIASDFAHLAAGALWGGALLALLLAMRVRPAAAESAVVAATRMQIMRFSPLGIAGVAIAAASGLILSAQHVHSPGELRSTEYGAVLLVKIAFVTAAVALAGLHKFVTLRRMRSSADVRGFERSLGVEMLLVTAIFGAAAVLTSTEPPPHTVTHQMADGSTHMMMTTDPDFERSLRIAALAIVVAGTIACALEWRARPFTQS